MSAGGEDGVVGELLAEVAVVEGVAGIELLFLIVYLVHV